MTDLETYLEALNHSNASIVVITLLMFVAVAIGMVLWRSVKWFPKAVTIALVVSVGLWTVALTLVNLPSGYLVLGAFPFVAILFLSRVHLEEQYRIGLPHNFIMGSILLIGLALRLHIIGDNLWYDEAFTARLISLDIGQLPAAIAQDVHPPLFYVLHWLWLRIAGDAPVVMRLPELALGMFAIVLMYRAAMNLGGLSQNTAYTAAFLMAISSNAAYYSTELRVYGLLIVVMLLMLIAWQKQSRWFFVLLALLPHLHNLGVIYMGMVAAYVFVVRWWSGESLKPVILAVLAGSAYTPIALALQSRQLTDGFWIQSGAGELVWTYLYAVARWMPSTDARFWIVLALPLLIFALLNSVQFFKDTKIVAVLLTVPLVLAVISAVWTPLLFPRAMVPISVLLLLPLANVLNGKHGGKFAALAIPAFTLALIGTHGYPTRTDYRAAMTGCTGATTMYATGIHTAMIGTQFMDVVVWEGAKDDGQTFTIEDMPVYGFEVASEPPPGACIMLIDSPRTDPAEREYVAALVGDQSPTGFTSSTEYYNVYTWRVDQ